MEKAYTFALFALMCVFYGLPTANASCHGRTPCSDTNPCTTGSVCLNLYCYICKCRLPEQCFLLSPNEVGCDCSDDSSYTGDHCECPVPTACDSGWELHDGSCYYFSPDMKSWTDAKIFCMGESAKLVKIDSTSEHDYITNKLTALGGDLYWIGGSYDSGVGGYRWLDGTTLGFNYWAFDMPGSIEGCMSYNYNAGSGYFWDWVAFSNCLEQTDQYICEKLA